MRDYDDYFYDGHYDDTPDYFDYDDSSDVDSYPIVCMALLGRIIMNCIMICMGRMTVGVYCVSRGDAGVVPYWRENEDGDVYEDDVALPRADSDEPVDGLGHSVISTLCPDGPGGPCKEEGDVALPRTGFGEPVNSVVRTSGPGDPGDPCEEEGDVCEGDVVRRTGQ